jgi:putative transposase
VFLAALLHRLPRVRLRQSQLIVSPDTILRRHRDLMIRRRHRTSPAGSVRDGHRLSAVTGRAVVGR